ncbi:MAG: rhomboid family intramembrane serine protease [Staphylothermus sp.]|nr:rhomboid family intramembrane serine protease [Staphylothermus sp.]
MFNPFHYSFIRRRSYATISLIIINVIIYAITSYKNMFIQTSQEWVDVLGLVPVLLQYPEEWYRLITSMFTHADIFHIFFNMYFLYFFGKEVESRIGSGRFLLLYFVSGFLATVFHVALTPLGGSLGLIIPSIGASGAISGVLGAYLLSYPRKRLGLCIFIPLPLCFTTTASYFLIFWFATQVIYGYARFASSIAYFAHAGGFVAGIVMLYLLYKPIAKKLETPYPYGIYWSYQGFPGINTRHLREGLGRFTKIILALLVLSLVIGSIVSAFNAGNVRGIYVYNISVTNQYGATSYDQAVYTLSGEYILPTKSDPRIVFNRLIWSGIISGKPEYTNNNYVYDKQVFVSDFNEYIHVYVKGYIKYDKLGVLTKLRGTMITDVLYLTTNPYLGIVRLTKIIRNVEYQVDIIGEEVAGKIGSLIIQPFSIISIIISITALLIVVSKDKELVASDFEQIWPGPIVPI